MIYVDRDVISLPEVFNSKEVDIAKKRLEEFYIASKEAKSQRRFSTPFQVQIASVIKRSLKELFKQKCAYCESLIPSTVALGDLDHFRPKNGARGLEDFSTEHYWWLSYEWGNMYYSCQMCNRYKSTWFPVEEQRANLLTPYKEIIRKEKALLIDPCNERPEEHLIYDEDGKVDFLTPKGKITIEILKLNRHELIEARRFKLNELFGEWELFSKLFRREKTNRKRIKKIAENWELLFTQFSENPYLGIQRYMLSKWISNNPDIQEYLSDRIYNKEEIFEKSVDIERAYTSFEKFQIIDHLDEEEKKLIEERLNIDQLKHVYIERIEINNFKCFSNIQIDLNNSNVQEIINKIEDNEIKNEPWLLFLGENGVGKSSLLKAIVIGLCGGEYLKKLEIKGADILKYGEESGFIKIYIVGEQEPIKVVFDNTKITASKNLPVVNLVAYNSIRIGPIKRKLIPEVNIFKNVKVKNLFDYSSSMIDANDWLLRRNRQIFDRVALTLKDLMMLNEKDKIEIFEDRIFVKKENEQRIAINELSDGYQSVYFLAIDIMATFVGEKTDFDLVEGMVIIDEIGTHLHPRWRMEVVERLRRAFPKIQFVVTTHEPLCLRGLRAKETVVLTKNHDDEVIALTELPDPSKLRVDQILTSDFFGLKSTIDPETERLFNEYYAILALEEKERSEEQKNRLLDLSQTIPRIKHLGDTEREELAYFVIDELLARKTRKDGPKIKKNLEEEALKRVESIWKTLDIKK